MTRSSLTTATTPYGTTVLKRNVRERGIDMFIVHHAASTSLEVVKSIFAQDGGRGTSANYIVGNAGEVIAAVPEEYRAWTSGGMRDGATVDGARYDHRAITVETVNATGAPGWTISAAAFDSLARLIEDCSARYGFPLDRDHVIGHRELLTRFKASYATACPGGIDVDALVQRARAIRAAQTTSTTTRGEEDMHLIRDTKGGATYLVTPHGTAHIKTPAHVKLFQRMLSAAPGDITTFNALEVDQIEQYVRSAK